MKNDSKFIVLVFFVFTAVTLASVALAWDKVDEATELVNSHGLRIKALEDELSVTKQLLQVSNLSRSSSPGLLLGNKKSVKVMPAAKPYCTQLEKSINILEFEESSKITNWELIRNYEKPDSPIVGPKINADYIMRGEWIFINSEESGIRKRRRALIENVGKDGRIIEFSIGSEVYDYRTCPKNI